MVRPDFSIVTPTYNRSRFLRLSLASSLRQKGVTLEIIVGDDCSKDDTKAVVRSFHDPRIKYFKNTRNLNTALNFKKCFLKCKGKYIFTLSDDDFLLDDDALLAVLKMMRMHDLGMGKLGTISYDVDPRHPYQSFILSEKKVIVKPERSKEILKDTIDFGLGFFSGLAFNNSYLNRTLLAVDHICKPGHLCAIYHSVMYDLITRRGIGYIPGKFVVSRMSTELMPSYFRLGHDDWFFLEDNVKYTRKFLTESQYSDFKKTFLHGEYIILPNIKYFTDTRSYTDILRKMIAMETSLLTSPEFIVFAALGYLPKFIIRWLRFVKIYGMKRHAQQAALKIAYADKLGKFSKDTGLLT